MTPTVAPAGFPDAAEGSALESVPEIPVDVLGPTDPLVGPGGEAIVPTTSRPGARPRGEPYPAGKQSAFLRRGTEKNRVRGWATRERLIQLHVFEGKSLKECARLLGRHYKRVHVLWRGIAEDAGAAGDCPEEHRASVRAYCDQHLRRVIEESQGLIGEAAAYGAVVVAGVKALAELHGLKPEEIAPEGLSLEDVGRQVRVVSPLLIDKIERVRAISGVSADRAAAREAREAENGVNL